jgi:secretion/DNA translocation related TadE-like protein
VSRPRGDHGSASVWVLACCALLMVIGGVATVRALAVLARHRAETGADLAALAGAGRIGVADDACSVAAANAARNAVRLTGCRVRLGPDGRSGSILVTVVLTASLPVVGERRVVTTARAGRLLAEDARYGMLAGALGGRP